MGTTTDDTSTVVARPPISTAVVEAVSSASNTPALELPPLSDVVDPDALDALFTDSRADGWAEFRYAGHLVTVHADGTVDVADAGR